MEFLKNLKLKTQEDDEEESLSLIDLPINPTHNKPKPEKPKPATDDFNFDLYNISVFNESEMCVADDVFFQGQILPYRHSISSDTGISLHLARTPYMSRSESMDHRSPRGMISSTNSRSSSINSQYSSSSGTGSLTGSINSSRNYFHSYPSPSPRIRTGKRNMNLDHLSRRSSLWDTFRVGLVKTPEIELRNIKNLRNNSRNSPSSCCSSQNRGIKIGDKRIINNIEKKKNKRFLDFGGCKCSVNVINSVNCIERDSRTGEKERQRKTTSSGYRTYEWIKELSVECGPGRLEA